MVELEIKADKYRIIKSNKLVNSRQSFSALQQRMITLLSSRIMPEDDELNEHEFHVSEIIRERRLGGREYKTIVDALKGLLSSQVQIEMIVEGKREWQGYNLFSKAKYSEASQVVSLSFAPEMKVFFLHLKGNYTSYLLKSVDGFKKAYTIRIYELCKQYYPLIKERKIPLEELKFLLSIENKYKTWSDFKKYVISPSLKEINTHSDLLLDYEPIKQGRKITEMKFLIDKNPNFKPSESEETVLAQAKWIEDKKLNDTQNSSDIPSWIDEKTYQKLLKKYDKSLIHFSIHKIEQKGEEIENPKAYLIKGLRNNWFVKESEEEFHQKEKIRKEKEAKQREQEAKNRKEELIQEFDQKRNERMNVWMEELSDDFIEEFILDFEDSEDSFLQGVAKRLDQGQRKELDLKKVVSWKVEEDADSTEEDVMFAKADIKKYASNLGIDW